MGEISGTSSSSARMSGRISDIRSCNGSEKKAKIACQVALFTVVELQSDFGVGEMKRRKSILTGKLFIAGRMVITGNHHSPDAP